MTFIFKRKKILFIIKLLIEEAIAWASPHVEEDSAILDDLNELVITMNQVFMISITELLPKLKCTVCDSVNALLLITQLIFDVGLQNHSKPSSAK